MFPRRRRTGPFFDECSIDWILECLAKLYEATRRIVCLHERMAWLPKDCLTTLAWDLSSELGYGRERESEEVYAINIAPAVSSDSPSLRGIRMRIRRRALAPMQYGKWSCSYRSLLKSRRQNGLRISFHVRHKIPRKVRRLHNSSSSISSAYLSSLKRRHVNKFSDWYKKLFCCTNIFIRSLYNR